MFSQGRNLAVVDSLNTLLFDFTLELGEIDTGVIGVVDASCTELALNDLSLNEEGSSGNSKDFDFNLGLAARCSIGLASDFEITLSLPLVFSSSAFDSVVPSVALQDSFVCSENLALTINGVDDASNIDALLAACDGADVDIILGELISDLSNDILDLVGPEVRNGDFDDDLENAIENLEDNGFSVVDADLITEIINFFVGQIEEIDFISEFLDVIRDPNSDLEDILEALEDILEEFDVEIDFDEYLDDFDELFPYAESGDLSLDLSNFRLPKRKLLMLARGRKAQAEDLPRELQDLIALLPAEFEDLIAALLSQNENLQQLLLEGTVADLFGVDTGFDSTSASIIGSLFGDTLAIDFITALLQIDLAALIGFLNFPPDLIVGLLFPAELVPLVFPDGIPNDGGLIIAEIFNFTDNNLNGLVIEADEPLSQEQINILRLVALFDPLIADNLERIENGEVDGAEFFGFLQIDRFEIEVEDDTLVIELQTLEFQSDFAVTDIDSAEFDIGVIQTPTININTLIITATAFVGLDGADEVDIVSIEIDFTAIFRAAAALVAGEDLTDIGLFGVEEGSDIVSVGEDVLACASSNFGFSVLAVEQSYGTVITTNFSDAGDADLENLLNTLFGDLYVAALPQLISNALNGIAGDAITLEGNAEEAAESCLATSLSAQDNGDDILPLILGIVGAIVGVAIIVLVAALIISKNRKASKSDVPVAKAADTKDAAKLDEGRKKVGVSF